MPYSSTAMFDAKGITDGPPRNEAAQAAIQNAQAKVGYKPQPSK